MIVKAVSLIVA